MTGFLIFCGLIIVIAGLFYSLVKQNNGQLKQVEIAINNEAATRRLKIIKVISPSFKEWSDSPFDKEIRIGTLGFEGIPYNRQYYRILKCVDQLSNSERTMWVRATRSHKTKMLTLEWMENN